MEHVNKNILPWHLSDRYASLRCHIHKIYAVECMYTWINAFNELNWNERFFYLQWIFFILNDISWNDFMKLFFASNKDVQLLNVDFCSSNFFCLQDLFDFIHWLRMSRMSWVRLCRKDPSTVQWTQFTRVLTRTFQSF